jgi:hypothetical protein
VSVAFALAADRLDGALTGPALVRHESLTTLRGPLDLKCALDPKAVRTPALELLSEELEWLITTPGARLIVSFSPQEGKSESVRHAVLRALQRNPDWRVAITSYAEWLARQGTGAIRNWIMQHGTNATDALTGEPVPDMLGLEIAPDNAAEGSWKLRGYTGGCIARGVGSGMTGAPVDFLVCDDPIKDARDAGSTTIRARLYDWWQQVSETRLAPNAPVIVVATRWHELDLSGWLIENDVNHEWRVVNIPALADGQTEDALQRDPGVWMESARGRTPEQWEKIRTRVGERAFASMYQGRPAPMEGGTFKRAWFDVWRVNERPAGCMPPTVVIDPADNDGEGDAAGIIVATSHPETGRVFILDDASAPMTVARWARLAMLTCVRRDAPTIAYERSLSQLKKRIAEAWNTLYREATAIHRAGGDLDVAVDRLMRSDDGPDVRASHELAVAEIADDADKILSFGATGPAVKTIHARGDKQFRMQLIAPMVETGRAAMVGKFPVLEHQLATWVPGMDSPDRADAFAHACALLGGMSSGSLGRADGRTPTRSTNRARGNTSRITRSTRR